MKENAPELTEQLEVFEFVSIGEVINQTLQKNIKQKYTPNCLPTGFSEIDKVISGLQKGQLITIAVKPGMGKTAFLLSLVNNVAIKYDYSVAIFSSERSNQKIASRLIESETGMSINKLMANDLRSSEKDRLHTILSNIAKARIMMDDTPSLICDELEKKARQLKLNHNIDLILIDYLELLNSGVSEFETREEQLSNIVNRIKSLAKELNLPIVLFSQYNNIKNRSNSLDKPTIVDIPVFLSELSDVVMFLNRAGFIDSSNKAEEVVEMIIAKYNNQNHNTFVPLKYIDSIAKFTDS